MVSTVNAQLDDIAENRVNIKNEYGYGYTNDMVATKVFLHIDSMISGSSTEAMKGSLLNDCVDEFVKVHELSESYSLGVSACLKQHYALIASRPSLVKQLLKVQNLNMWLANTSGWNNCWAGWQRTQTLLTHEGDLTFNGYHEGLHIFRVQFKNERPIWACSHQSIPIPPKWKKGDPLFVAILDNFTDKPTDVKVYLQ